MSHHRESDWNLMALGLILVNRDLMEFYEQDEVTAKTARVQEFLRDLKDSRDGETWFLRKQYFTTYDSHLFVLNMESEKYDILVAALAAFLLNPTKQRAYVLMTEHIHPLQSTFNSKERMGRMGCF